MMTWPGKATLLFSTLVTLSVAQAKDLSDDIQPHTYRTSFALDLRLGMKNLPTQAARREDITLADDPVTPGNRAIRVVINRGEDFSGVANGSPRTEFLLPPNIRLAPGSEYLISWKTYLPRNFAFDHQQWEIITQIHHSALSGPPPFMLTLNGADYALSVRGGENTTHGSGVRICCAMDDVGRWVDWTLQYAPDATGHRARTRLWKDGREVFNGDGMPNAYPDDNRAYLKFGIYKPEWLIQPSDVQFIEIYYGAVAVGEKPVRP
jgi:hypothetical protein